MLQGMVALLFLTSGQPTIFEFERPVEYFAVNMESYLSKNKKVLLVHPKKKEFDDFLVVITKGKSYQLRLKSSPQKGNALYKIKDAEKEKLYHLKIKTSRYKILESKSLLKIVRLKGTYLQINGQRMAQKNIFYPRNANLIIENKRIY